MYFLDILIGFSQSTYTTAEAEEQVSVCVGPINTKETRYPYEVALLPDKSLPLLRKQNIHCVCVITDVLCNRF